MKKGNWKYSAFKGKCPRCQNGDLWEKEKAYSKGFSEMKENCSHCSLKYDMEQGFWYGAMYISYALGVAVTVAVAVAMNVLTELGVIPIAVVCVAALVLTMPLTFRYSRNIWLNIFVHYEATYDKEVSGNSIENSREQQPVDENPYEK